jgi:D-glycero-alpha-D-manno-heptose 1-phosphate guanylyltransferase
VSPAPALARIPVAILAGGLGTRLRPAIGDRPKVVAEVAGRPFAAWLLDQLAAAGFREAVLCVGWQADLVVRALGDAHGPLRLRYSREASPLGTAGALRRALPLLAGERAMVMNGDSYCDADLAAAWAWHDDVGSQATLLLAEVSDTSRFGRVELGDDGSICRFVEKQQGGGPGLVNAGIYLLSRARIEAIPPDAPLSLEHDVFPGWVGRGLRGRVASGRFLDIGTPRSYADASAFFRAEGRESPA